MSIYSIIVSYNPNIQNLNNLIKSITNHSIKVLVVDNSKTKNLFKIKNFETIHLGENKGISFAQNKGIEIAKKRGAKFFIFFDQDSQISSMFFNNILSNYSENDLHVRSPLILDKESDEPMPSIKLNNLGFTSKFDTSKALEPQQTDLIISSGTVVNLKTLNIVGLMDENLFIDFVDTEWSFRCKKENIPIYIIPNAIIKHSIGKKNFKFLNMTFFVHNSRRIYFQFRNCIILFSKNHVPNLFVLKELISLIFHSLVVIFFKKNSFKSLKNIFLGLMDGFKFILNFK